MSEPTLLLIRHAESSWNASGRWQGHADPPLSVRGVEQANALAEQLASERIDVIVSSDLRRAAETAAILARARGLRPLLNPRLRELDLGRWEGLTRDQIERADGAVLRCFDSGDLDVRPGGGENLREIAQRAHSAVAELIAAHPDRRLAVVTHLGVIRALRGGFARSDSGIDSGLASPDAEAGISNACWRRLAIAEFFDSARSGDTVARRSSESAW